MSTSLFIFVVSMDSSRKLKPALNLNPHKSSTRSHEGFLIRIVLNFDLLEEFTVVKGVAEADVLSEGILRKVKTLGFLLLKCPG